MSSLLFLSALCSGGELFCNTGAATCALLCAVGRWRRYSYTCESSKPCSRALRASERQHARDNAPAVSLSLGTLIERSSKCNP